MYRAYGGAALLRVVAGAEQLVLLSDVPEGREYGDGREYDGGGMRRAWNSERVNAWRDRRDDICRGAGAARTRPDGT